MRTMLASAATVLSVVGRTASAQAQTRIRNLELRIATEVRDAGCQVNMNSKRVDATKAARQLAERRSIHEIDIAVRRVMSPKEFQNRAHLYAGALYGLSPLASPATLFKYRSPIRALYQAGQTTWPGFGVASAGMSGVMAADALIYDE